MPIKILNDSHCFLIALWVISELPKVKFEAPVQVNFSAFEESDVYKLLLHLLIALQSYCTDLSTNF